MTSSAPTSTRPSSHAATSTLRSMMIGELRLSTNTAIACSIRQVCITSASTSTTMHAVGQPVRQRDVPPHRPAKARLPFEHARPAARRLKGRSRLLRAGQNRQRGRTRRRAAARSRTSRSPATPAMTSPGSRTRTSRSRPAAMAAPRAILGGPRTGTARLLNDNARYGVALPFGGHATRLAPRQAQVDVFVRNILDRVVAVDGVDFDNLTADLDDPRIIGAEGHVAL